MEHEGQPRPADRWVVALLIAAWVSSMALLLAEPLDGSRRVRISAWAAGLGWAVAVGLLERARAAEWATDAGRAAQARWAWGLGWLAMAVHVLLAFEHYHGWSHAAAVRHNQAAAGFGAGVWVSYAFVAVWGIDAVWWWLWPRAYAARRRWVGWVVHGFLGFLVFNGTVVFADGWSRWGGVAVFAGWGAVAVARRRRDERTDVPAAGSSAGAGVDLERV